MSERHTHHEKSPEHWHPQEHKEHEPKHHEKAHEHREHESAQPEKDIEQLRATALQEAVSGREVTVGEQESSPAGSQPLGLHQALKSKAYRQALTHIRHKLSPSEKTLSKIIHQPTVDAISESASGTVARPSGLLGGGACALLGSIVLLYASKHYGFTYNYGVFFLLFAGGFFLGLTLELLLWKKRSRTS